jgi:hypothetical protein
MELRWERAEAEERKSWRGRSRQLFLFSFFFAAAEESVMTSLAVDLLFLFNIFILVFLYGRRVRLWPLIIFL